MIESNLGHQLWSQWLPIDRSRRGPAAGAAWCIARETGRRDKLFKAGRQCGFVLVDYGGGEAEVMQQAPALVKAK